ncbi:hypothetical protein [Aquabacterium sp.]|uniref:hypothetical protein n=1 Tax=Aquabacterium sp. TaxID=1872578 RepID=UPI003783D24F
MHPPKLLTDLDQRIRNPADPVAWGRDMCRRAAYFARMGRAKAATKDIDEVKARFGHQLDTEVACWLLLAEGALHFFQERPSEAYDRFRTAYGMAVAFDLSLARPTCAAWMAHIEINENRFESMIRFLGEALCTADAEDHHTLGRASLVLATAYHFSGSFEKAQPWYECTRRHATTEGDRSMLSAMFHNIAAFRVSNLRLSDAFGEEISEAVTARASLEASSALTYDLTVRSDSYELLVPTIRGQLLTVEKRFYEAIVVFASIDETLLPSRLRPLVSIDRAWCSLSLGLEQEGRELALAAVQSIGSDLDADDLAFVLARVSAMEAILKMSLIPFSRDRSLELLAAHRHVQRELEMQLDQFTSKLHLGRPK